MSKWSYHGSVNMYRVRRAADKLSDPNDWHKKLSDNLRTAQMCCCPEGENFLANLKKKAGNDLAEFWIKLKNDTTPPRDTNLLKLARVIAKLYGSTLNRDQPVLYKQIAANHNSGAAALNLPDRMHPIKTPHNRRTIYDVLKS